MCYAFVLTAPARATRLFGNHNNVTGHEVTGYLGPIDINNSRLGKGLGKLSELIMGNPHDVTSLRCTPGMGALQLVLWSEPFP